MHDHICTECGFELALGGHCDICGSNWVTSGAVGDDPRLEEDQVVARVWYEHTCTEHPQEDWRDVSLADLGHMANDHRYRINKITLIGETEGTEEYD